MPTGCLGPLYSMALSNMSRMSSSSSLAERYLRLDCFSLMVLTSMGRLMMRW